MSKLFNYLQKYLPSIITVAETGGLVAYLSTADHVSAKTLSILVVVWGTLKAVSLQFSKHSEVKKAQMTSLVDQIPSNTEIKIPITSNKTNKLSLEDRAKLAANAISEKYAIVGAQELIAKSIIDHLTFNEEKIIEGLNSKLSPIEKKILGL